MKLTKVNIFCEERERQTVSYYNKEFKTETQDIKENKLQQQQGTLN